MKRYLTNAQWAEIMASATAEDRQAAALCATIAQKFLKKEFWRGWRYGAVLAGVGTAIGIAVAQGKITFQHETETNGMEFEVSETEGAP